MKELPETFPGIASKYWVLSALEIC